MYDSFRPFAPAPQPREFQEVHCWNQHLWESVGMQARSDCNHVPHFKAFQLWLLLLPNVLTLKPVAVAGGRAASENMGIIWYDHHTPLWRQDMLKGFAFLQLNSSPFFSAEVSEVMCPHKLVSIQITWSIFSDSAGDMGQFLKEVLFPAAFFSQQNFASLRQIARSFVQLKELHKQFDVQIISPKSGSTTRSLRKQLTCANYIHFTETAAHGFFHFSSQVFTAVKTYVKSTMSQQNDWKKKTLKDSRNPNDLNKS